MCAESLPGIGERCSLEQLRQPGHSLCVPLLPRHSVNLPVVPKSSSPAQQSSEWPADPRAALLEPLWDSEGSEGKHVLLSSASIHLGLLHLTSIWYKGPTWQDLGWPADSWATLSGLCETLKAKIDSLFPQAASKNCRR